MLARAIVNRVYSPLPISRRLQGDLWLQGPRAGSVYLERLDYPGLSSVSCLSSRPFASECRQRLPCPPVRQICVVERFTSRRECREGAVRAGRDLGAGLLNVVNHADRNVFDMNSSCRFDGQSLFPIDWILVAANGQYRRHRLQTSNTPKDSRSPLCGIKSTLSNTCGISDGKPQLLPTE